MKLTKKSVYIGLFSILYLIVAFSSFFHACSFFGLANNSWMSIILAFAFEIGQAAVLFSLLTSSKDRSRIMPWVLMFMFTLVQVIGNVFSSYKYIVTNSVADLRYFKEPIFIWTNIPDDQATVIIVYLVGALLPIAALLLTSMVTNYLSDQEELDGKSEEHEEDDEQYVTTKDEEIDNLKKELEKLRNDKNQFDEEKNKSDNDDGKQDVETSVNETTTENETPEDNILTNIEKDEEINSENNKQGVEQIELKKENNESEENLTSDKIEERKHRDSRFVNL